MTCAAAVSLSAFAQTAETPIMTMRTSAYDPEAEVKVSFYLGADVATDVVVEYGPKRETYHLEPGAEDTFVQGVVPEDGYIRVYGDNPRAISVVDCTGMYLTEADMTALTNLSILMLPHNELTEFDFSKFENLNYLDLKDNQFTDLVLDTPWPALMYLDLSYCGNINPSFSMGNYPTLLHFVAQSTDITHLDPSQCPALLRLSVDGSMISSIDVSHNDELMILNVSETRVTDIDVSQNYQLRELYCEHTGTRNHDYKINSIDVSENTGLTRLFCAGNNLTDIDITNNLELTDLYVSNNRLSNLDVTKHIHLVNLSIRRNDFDFATLPEVEKWVNVEWQPMNAIPVAPAYKAGSVIDLASKVLRAPGDTHAQAMMENKEDPNSPFELVEGTDFTYADGKVTMLTAQPDSCWVEFYNTYVAEMYHQGGVIRTSSFLMKPEEEFGKPSLAARLGMANYNTDLSQKVWLRVSGASYDNPVTVYVDYGDGVQVPLECRSEVALDGNASGGNVDIYIPDGHALTSLEIENVQLSSLDVTKSPRLANLSVTRCGLPAIDLQWNNELETLDLSGNALTELNLSGANKAFVKNVLTHIYAANNKLESVIIENHDVPSAIDLSNNKLTQIDITEMESLTDINLSNNALTELSLSGCYGLQLVNVAQNQLRELIFPQCPLLVLHAENNRFNIATMPVVPADIQFFTYAPQAPMTIGQRAAGVNLASQNIERETSRVVYDDMGNATIVTETNPTVFAWFDSNGTELEEGVEYTITDGYTKFLEPALGNEVYCEMTNASLPALSGDNALRTTLTLVSPLPDYELASFTTPRGGQTAKLSLAATEENVTVYIDWSGKGELHEYDLTTMYRRFEAETTAGAKVRVLAYNDYDPIYVFSIQDADMRDIDITKLTNAYTINVSDSHCEQLTLPVSDNLCEVMVDNCDLFDLDVTKLPNLHTLYASFNFLDEIDLSNNPKMAWLMLSDNELGSIDLTHNPEIVGLALMRCGLSEIDLSNNRELWNLGLAGNYLTEIDLSNNPNLHQVILDENRFTFTTLPLPEEQWGNAYTYAGQAMLPGECIDGYVDFSSQVAVGDTKTVYRWFRDVPELDENNELVGDELVLGEDYIIEDGVTGFRRTFPDGVLCVMTNEVFPDLYLLSLVYVDSADVNEVAAEQLRVSLNGRDLTVFAPEAQLWTVSGMRVPVTAADGVCTARSLQPGVYVLTAAGQSRKLIVK